MLASASRSVYLMDTYWADSTGRRNTFNNSLFEQLVERLSRRMRISEIRDSDFANSRTPVSVIPGQSGQG
jgi:hypothetical protein